MSLENVNASGDRPLSALEILNVIRTQIKRLDEDTDTYVGDLGELNTLLCTLHWLYAMATGRMEDFHKASLAELPAEFLECMRLIESHEAVGPTDGTRAILNRWKTRGVALGLE